MDLCNDSDLASGNLNFDENTYNFERYKKYIVGLSETKLQQVIHSEINMMFDETKDVIKPQKTNCYHFFKPRKLESNIIRYHQ
jgi:hypothetical protein